MLLFGFLTPSFRRLLPLLLLAGVATGTMAAPAPDAESLAAATSVFLRQYVSPEGNVNYKALKARPAALQTLLRQVKTFNAKAATAAERKAFYLNAYNLTVIGAVVERYPLQSVMKVPGFFDKNLYLVAGEKLTLNNLEATRLRQPYNDPRIHFALVCAAVGCPRLSREAYAPATLDAQLTAQARRVLTNPEFIRVDAGAKKVLVSEIFKWYADDFKAGGKATVAYINQFRGAQPIPAGFTTDYYAYDWTLNDQAR
ncbi:DUF547 domain-containing protein [Hymenobacter fastidiosus]|uniref:DUF547 domain-containing protein n=1 Tax=Hymenobacter fastidiosus TaxID=486264 RepID=A0ABP7RHJ6_9BACT